MLNNRLQLRAGGGEQTRWRPFYTAASVGVLFSLAGGVFAATPGSPEAPPPAPWLEENLPTEFQPGDPWCRYPLSEPRENKALRRKARAVTVNEIDPNDITSDAQLLLISSEIGQEIDIDVAGTIAPGADLDFYRFTATKGDVIGLTVLAQDPLDPMVGIFEINEAPLIVNDDDRGLSGLYPPESPFVGSERPLDSSLTWVAPANGEYAIRVSSFASSSNGDYTLRVMSRRPAFEHLAVGATQVIFLDFDGVDDLNAVGAFGSGWFTTQLSPMRAFLAGWGLTWEDEADVVDAIIAVIEENYNDLRSAALNGDRDTDFIDGHFDVEFRNSRDHPDPWGDTNVSRVIIGGTINELGIPTIGIAESIDPGNFGREESAVVLLDLLSLPDPNDPYFPNSINQFRRAPGFTIFDAIGRVVGNIASHEAGHYLGLWHTDNQNNVPCLIDQGGNLGNLAGVGPDGVLGSADDLDVDFIPDEYIENEAIAVGLELTDVRVSFALSTGTRLDIEPPPLPPAPPVATASIRATPTVGPAPLSVQLAGGGIDPEGGQFLVFNWNFGDGTPGDSGPLVNHTYASPGNYLVTLTATTDSAQTAEATERIVVTSGPNEAPLVSFVATPRTGKPPLVVFFEANASDPDGTIARYEWDFGDGSTGTGQTAEHVYLDAGIFVVTLTVTDDGGATRRATEVVIVAVDALDSATASATVPESGGGLGVPLLQNCGAGTTGATMAGLAIMLALNFVRRRW